MYALDQLTAGNFIGIVIGVVVIWIIWKLVFQGKRGDSSGNIKE
jgi:hypothetical protein